MKRSGLLAVVAFLLALQRVGCGKWARNNGIVGDVPGPAVRTCVCDYRCVLGVSARERVLQGCAYSSGSYQITACDGALWVHDDCLRGPGGQGPAPFSGPPPGSNASRRKVVLLVDSTFNDLHGMCGCGMRYSQAHAPLTFPPLSHF